MRQVTDRQRRARLASRHALASRAGSVAQAVGQMTCLHATEPASVYLSVLARVEASRADIERALYDERSVVKQLAMRRTLFAFPRDLLPAVWGSASDRVAQQLHTRLAKEVEGNGLSDDGMAWVSGMCEAVLRTLARDGPATTAELRERVPPLARRLELAPGKAYGGNFPIAPRLLSTLGATGRVVRGINEGEWHTSRPRWVLTEEWLGEPLLRSDRGAGYAILVDRWLRTFGPGTEADLVWWLGATKGAVRQALGELGAVEVRLTEGVGYLLPDDLEDVLEPDPWPALLPVLDPTTMGWKQRAFYLREQDVPHLFDTNGNAGTTAWWDGQIVGCWVQDEDGSVSVVLRHDIGSDGVRALDAEAIRLSDWLGGHRVGTVYTSALMRSGR
jgi:DNA glycosylase AlkZ-like